MVVKIRKIKKKFISFGKKTFFNLALLIASMGQADMSKANPVITQWVNTHPEAVRAINQEKQGDGFIYLVSTLDLSTELLIDIKENPQEYELSFNKDEFICNSLVQAISKIKKGQVIVEVNLKTGEITNFFDKSAENMILKHNKKEEKIGKKDYVKFIQFKVLFNLPPNDEIIYSGKYKRADMYFIVYRNMNMDTKSYRIVIGNENGKFNETPYSVEIGRNGGQIIKTQSGIFNFRDNKKGTLNGEDLIFYE